VPLPPTALLIKDKVEFGILGGGIAGAFIAFRLHQAGVPFYWAHQSLPGEASPIAPGLINPLAGKKVKPGLFLQSYLQAAQQLFDDVQSTLGRSFWHPLPIHRLFTHQGQADHFNRNSLEDKAFWAPRLLDSSQLPSTINAPFGGCITEHGGWLDIPRLTQAIFAQFPQQRTSPESLSTHCNRLIDCRGWRASSDPLWNDLPWKPARGELLIIRLENELPPVIWNSGVWLKPLGNLRWMTGATYAWDHFEAKPTEQTRRELESKLRSWLKIPFTVEQHLWGVRPVLNDYLPVIGEHPNDPTTCIFNGLGSKGALQGPYYATCLVDYLLHQSPLPKEVDVRRFEDKKRT